MANNSSLHKAQPLAQQRLNRATAIRQSGSVSEAVTSGLLTPRLDLTVSEALILGLINQDVRSFVTVLGHGSTEIGEVLRVYEAARLVKTYGVRNEVEASHAATALRWVTGEKAAVVTSIGPGAMQALAASLVPASNYLGVWYLFGDETTEDEGPNMQQIPKPEQNLFLKLCSTMGAAYTLHTPLALSTALRRGLTTVEHPHHAGPFYLLLPMNIQPAVIRQFNLNELPAGPLPQLGAAADTQAYTAAYELLTSAQRIAVKVGGGARWAGEALLEFLELVDGVVVLSPTSTGVIPFEHPRNMQVGGSKGSISGNYAMEHCDLVVTIGTRFVCQSDCSRTGYLSAKQVISINTDFDDTVHYSKSVGLWGDAAATLAKLNELIKLKGLAKTDRTGEWLASCKAKREEWEAFKLLRYHTPTLYDETRKRELLTQPAAIKIATDWARSHEIISFFDAGDVQANGFQIVEDERVGQTYTDTGASYMGFAVSAVLSTALATQPFYGLALTGDGSLTMNPQILIDGVAHGARGCILVLDNQRMAAISALQMAQYGHEHATADHIPVDYCAWAAAIKGVAAFHGGYTPESLLDSLEQARQYQGLSLIHVPVYYGPNELGGLGAFGRWNVGSWVESTQALRHDLGL